MGCGMLQDPLQRVRAFGPIGPDVGREEYVTHWTGCYRWNKGGGMIKQHPSSDLIHAIGTLGVTGGTLPSGRCSQPVLGTPCSSLHTWQGKAVQCLLGLFEDPTTNALPL